MVSSLPLSLYHSVGAEVFKRLRVKHRLFVISVSQRSFSATCSTPTEGQRSTLGFTATNPEAGWDGASVRHTTAAFTLTFYHTKVI